MFRRKVGGRLGEAWSGEAVRGVVLVRFAGIVGWGGSVVREGLVGGSGRLCWWGEQGGWANGEDARCGDGGVVVGMGWMLG